METQPGSLLKKLHGPVDELGESVKKFGRLVKVQLPPGFNM